MSEREERIGSVSGDRMPTVRKILLVGEVNPRGGEPEHALFLCPKRAAENRMRLIFGLIDREYLEIFDRTNLCAARWNFREAVMRADDLIETRRSVYVLLGLKVRTAFERALAGWSDNPKLEVFESVTFGWDGCHQFVCLPRLNGQYRVWNESGRAEHVRAMMRSVAPLERWGASGG